jgi:hypothetical protein
MSLMSLSRDEVEPWHIRGRRGDCVGHLVVTRVGDGGQLLGFGGVMASLIDRRCGNRGMSREELI